MGSALSCCGGSRSDSNFKGEGRTLDGPRPAPTQQQTIPARASTMGQGESKQQSFGGQGRTLSGGANQTMEAAASEQPQPRTEDIDAAAKAREERAKAIEARTSKQPAGKIGLKLSEEKRKTNTDLLVEQAQTTVGSRKQDAGSEARAHN